MSETMKVISLGWGVQSWTLAAMVALGELESVDVALHSDTTWERQTTYEFARQWTPWLQERGVRVIQVSDGDQAAKMITGEPDIPAFTQAATDQITNEHGGVFAPAHTTCTNGNPAGMLRRQCTHRWKIRPMRRFLSDLILTSGLYWEDVCKVYHRGKISKAAFDYIYRVSFERVLPRLKKGPGVVEQWLGITLDEVERAKDSDVQWITHRFPLLEKKMTRLDCLAWLESKGLPTPGKSSCVFCPYHTRRVFAEMKRDGGPDWETAVEVDEAIRSKRPGFIAYVHPDRIPLIDVKIAEDFGATQLSFTDLSNAECDSGYCFL